LALRLAQQDPTLAAELRANRGELNDLAVQVGAAMLRHEDLSERFYGQLAALAPDLLDRGGFEDLPTYQLLDRAWDAVVEFERLHVRAEQEWLATRGPGTGVTVTPGHHDGPPAGAWRA